MMSTNSKVTIMTVKKQFVELVAFLEANQKKNVSTILDAVREMCSSSQTVNFKKDAEGNVTEVFCYYHKVWESVSEHEYGKKASNKATGLNTMCKVGVNAWTKEQRAKSKTRDELLDQLAKGEITADELIAKLG